jgi:large subunit ribosomal protein L6
MSRIGKQPITVPSGVTVSVSEGVVQVAGPKGALSQAGLPGVTIKQNDDQTVTVTRQDDTAENKARHGLMRALVNNMVRGVSHGFEKRLELVGVGYRVTQAGNELKFNIGFSHEVTYRVPEGVSAKVEQNTITISGIDKQRVGQVAAEIRSLKKPEPYKGKGIRYADEQIIRKSGKSGKDK